MAGAKVNNYSQVDSNILELQLTTDKTFKGYHQLTLTNYDNTTVPAIAAGSATEVNGALYKFDSEEAISTTDPVTSATVADGTVYVCIVPGTTTCTAAFTATAPTWSDSKQGWYGTGGQANYRYAEFICHKSSTSYYGKTRMFMNNGDVFYYAADATERTTTATTQTDENNLSVTIPLKKGCLYDIYFILETYRTGSASSSGYIYNNLTTMPSSITFINHRKYDGNIFYGGSSSVQKIICPASYEKYIIHDIFFAESTASYSHKMSWLSGTPTYTGTAYVKNRKFIIKEKQGLSIL